MNCRFVSDNRQSPTRKQFLEKQASRKITLSDKTKNSRSSTANNSKFILVGANTVLFFGMSVWLLLLVDRYFRNRERECMQKAHEQLHADFGDLDEFAEKFKDHRSLGRCMVRMKSRELKQLFPVQVGEVVDVLVEGVGTEKSLNVCRTRPKNSKEQPMVGLYPMGCLQRVILDDATDEIRQQVEKI